MTFLRFTKGRHNGMIKYFKGVVIDSNAFLEYDDEICAIASLVRETDKIYKWDIIYKSVDGFTDEQIKRKVTNMIGTSYKFSNLSKKRKSYSYSKQTKLLKPYIFYH